MSRLNGYTFKPLPADAPTKPISLPRGRERDIIHIEAARPARAQVTLRRADTIKPEPVNWLWNGYLAAGKMHILGGAPGTGKTTIAMSFAAAVTGGNRWPDETRPPVGNVVIWSGEDDPADTLVPRLVAAGADLSRVHFISDVMENGKPRSFDPAKDVDSLKVAIAAAGGARLLIVDPIVSAVAGDSHKNTEVRRALQPLVDLAAEARCALIGVTHFSKGTGGREPVERLSGSLAFGALARVVMVAAKEQSKDDDDQPARRIFARAKSNIGPDDGAFVYDLTQTEIPAGIIASYVLWGAQLEGSAREILAEAEEVRESNSAGDEAVNFLNTMLADGAKAVKELKTAASAHGIGWRTIERLKKSLGVETRKGGMSEGWVWQFAEDRQKSPSWKVGDVRGLRGVRQDDDTRRPPKNTEDREGDQENETGNVGGVRCDDDYTEASI